jgi:hypothetical protein
MRLLPQRIPNALQSPGRANQPRAAIRANRHNHHCHSCGGYGCIVGGGGVMQHTVEKLMALAYDYADNYADSYEVEQDNHGLRIAREALRTALTEALQAAQPVSHALRPWEKAILAPPHPGHFGIPKEHWETAQNYANVWHNNRLEATRPNQEVAQPVLAPLTDEQIQAIYISEYNKGHHGRDFENLFARAIERAHHIGISK